jgi:hypothetical protein
MLLSTHTHTHVCVDKIMGAPVEKENNGKVHGCVDARLDSLPFSSTVSSR